MNKDKPTQWRTIAQVVSNPIFNKVKVGDDVAIRLTDEGDWWQGHVRAIETYKNQNSRFQERPVLIVECHTTSTGVRRFYEHNVEEILFKD